MLNPLSVCLHAPQLEHVLNLMLAYVLHALCAMRACPSSSSLSLISIFIIVIIIIVIVTIVVTLIIVTIIIAVIIITVIIIITMQNYTSDASVSSEKTGTSDWR